MKRIYYVSRLVKDVLELHLAVGQKIKVASVGLKMLINNSHWMLERQKPS